MNTIFFNPSLYNVRRLKLPIEAKLERVSASIFCCRYRAIKAISFVIMFLMLIGCSNNDAPILTQLRVSAIPDQSAEAVHLQHDLIVERLCKTISFPCEWVDAKNYDDVVDKLGRGDIDFAYFGGAMFVIANKKYGAIPLAIRDIDMRFTSALIVASESGIRSLRELRGQSLLFGARRSTSGHIMPRHFLTELGINPEAYFKTIDYSRGHDDTLRRIASGEFTAGMVNGSIAAKAIASGSIHGIRVIWETPPYVDYVWAARSGLPEDIYQRLVDGFLDFRLSEPQMRIALHNESALGYLPAYAEDFTTMESALRSQGLLAEAK